MLRVLSRNCEDVLVKDGEDYKIVDTEARSVSTAMTFADVQRVMSRGYWTDEDLPEPELVAEIIDSAI